MLSSLAHLAVAFAFLAVEVEVVNVGRKSVFNRTNSSEDLLAITILRESLSI